MPEQKRRRVRLTGAGARTRARTISPQRREEVNSLLRQYVNQQAKALAATQSAAAIAIDLEARMREYGIAHDSVSMVSGEVVAADLKEVIGNASSVVDPAKFYNAVKDKKAAFAAMRVSLTDAKELLSGKELDRITTVTPGKSKGVQLVISSPKKKK